MGFGNGYSNRTKRGGKSYNNQMLAHVWNAGEERLGQSSNGNFYFQGAAIYSYGSHFVIAYRMPDGTVFLNADSYSVSTSGHQSDVANAVNDRRTVRVPGLSDLAGDWKLLPRLAGFLADIHSSAEQKAEMQRNVRVALATHALALSAEIYAPGAEHYSYEYEPTFKRTPLPGIQEAGAYLAALVGLPAASWPKIKREAAERAASDAAIKAKAHETAAIERALRLADMTPQYFRDQLNRMTDCYNASNLVEMGKELKRARGLMLKAKSGKLAAKSRLATIRARIKDCAHFVETYSERHEIRNRQSNFRRALADVKAWRDASDAGKALATHATFRDLASAGERLAQFGRIASLKASGAEIARLAHIGQTAITAENDRLRLIERAENEKRMAAANAEREANKLKWLAGDSSIRMRFDAEGGGAALRVIGDTLETSHGAEVPLAHAVKVFRFVKLCRDKGESWHRNGKTIRVGHFQVDRVYSSGDFVAGCHTIAWPEVERVAKIAGVFDCPPSDLALEASHA